METIELVSVRNKFSTAYSTLVIEFNTFIRFHGMNAAVSWRREWFDSPWVWGKNVWIKKVWTLRQKYESTFSWNDLKKGACPI